MKIATRPLLIITIPFILFITGCHSTMNNEGQMDLYPVADVEANWIRNGEPIEYDGKLWYPQDDTENLMDAEVYLLGEYKGVEFFIDKKDVKPYNRLYTKFARNKYRYFEAK